ncbi:hypothetical protein EDD85DRAFT_790578 [Armillaria nabsnona]|nr:hypothetical protein EDD85DRAFT_790578 [Armillaria nabsnona]
MGKGGGWGLLNNERGVRGPGAWQIHVPPPKEWGIPEDGVAGVVAWRGGHQHWCSVGQAVHQSTTAPTIVTVIAVIVFVIIIMASSVFDCSSHAEMMSWLAAIGTDVDAGGAGHVGMILGVGFVALAEHGRGHRHQRMNCVAASSEGLCGWWWEDTCNPEFMGAPDAWKTPKKQLEVIK